MVRPSKTIFFQDGIRVGREIAIGKKQQFYALAQFLLAKEQWIYGGLYVSHVDI
jgi:hypothetical protein